MERLTKKDKRTKLGVHTPTYSTNLEKRIYLKLFNLENLEEELGIDLITLFKALKEDIYYNDCGKIIKVPVLDISPMRENKFCLECYYDFKKFRVDTRDYGKTWSLRKEDLEDEN